MSTSYTENLGFANPAPGDCNWDNDWARNQYISDVILAVLSSTNRVLNGGVVSLTGGLNISVSAGSANISGTTYSWDETHLTVTNSDAEAEYLSNWLWVDSAGDIQLDINRPTGDFVALAVIDADYTSILRQYDMRSFTTDASILPEITKVLSATSVVDAVIYDTANDPDGGLWRYKSKWASWYNETLNTSTRGSKRGFPSRVLIVAESDKVTFYDLTDSNLSMWYKIFRSAFSDSAGYRLFPLGRSLSSVALKKGVLSFGTSYSSSTGSTGFCMVDFINDKYSRIAGSDVWGGHKNRVSTIKDDVLFSVLGSGFDISNNLVNDVAMTVLDGNDYPTIAVATDSGVSVIDGLSNIIDIGTSSGAFSGADFDGGRLYCTSSTGEIYAGDIPTVDTAAIGDWSDAVYSDSSIPAINQGTDVSAIAENGVVFNPGANAVNILKEDSVTPENGMVANITNKFNTGWMKGDVKLASLCDSVEETVGIDTTTEFVTNGTFDIDSGWVKGDGWSIGSGVASCDGTQTANTNFYPSSDTGLIDEEIYILEFDYAVSIGSFSVYLYGQNTFEAVKIGINGSGSFSQTVKLSSSTINSINGVMFQGGITFVGTIDNVSIKRSQNLVENGEFSSDRGWKAASGDPLSINGWSISGGVMSFDGSSPANSGAYANTTQDVGKTYVIKGTVTAHTGTGNLTIYSGLIEGGIIFSSGVGDFSKVFTSSQYRQFTITATTKTDTWSIDNIEIYELDIPDRSINSNDGRIVGELQKTAVASNADLVAYSGWSTDNYIDFPHSDDFNFGVDDFFVSYWSKPESTTSSRWILNKRLGSVDGFMITHSLGYIMKTGSISFSSGITPTYDVYSHVLWKRESDGKATLYLNGVKVFEDTQTVQNVDTTEPILVGIDNSIAYPFKGQLSNIKVCSGTISDDEVKAIYEAERRMFQENAKCILSESDVSCIAYDSDSDQLMVGVTDGASSHIVDTFQGLVKIDSTVTTAEPIAVIPTINERVIAEDVQVTYTKELVSLNG